ncbi:MAG TPA: low specificity L-threonine aldolase [Candidatus Caenarcaniphilales bacterium]
MNFCSDNITKVAPEIMAALLAANHSEAMPYGHDPVSQRLEASFSELFETAVTVFPVATGSAANALALSVITPPYGAVYCHAASHINTDECGAPEFYTGGAKLIALPGAEGKLNATCLAGTLDKAGAGIVHHVQPAAVSLTQASEAGTVYPLEEIGKITRVAHAHGLAVHMDGARFANAVVSLGCTPAEMTWRAGVDVLSFGATKNGAMAAEAVVFFNSSLARTFGYRRKRGGHLWSKMRFLAAQLEAYIAEELWLRNAVHANQMARQLAVGLQSLPEATLCYPVEANEVFVILSETVVEGLLADGFQFYRWASGQGSTIRLVTAFDTQEADVAAFLAAARSHATVAATLN